MTMTDTPHPTSYRAGFSMKWIHWNGVEGSGESVGEVMVDGRVVPATITEHDYLPDNPHRGEGFTFAFELPNGLIATCVADDHDAPLYLWASYDTGVPVNIVRGVAIVDPECLGFECPSCHHRSEVGSFETYEDLMALLGRWSVLPVMKA